MGIAMKKTIIIFLLLSIYSLAQENRLIRQNDLTDSLDAIRTLIGTGGSLPDSVLFSSDSTNQRTFSDLKYVDKSSTQTITGQKNFSSQLKTLGTNTNISLDENWIGFFRNTTAEVPYGIAWLDSAENNLWTSGMDYEGSDLALVWDGRTNNDVLRVSTGGIWTMGHIAGSPALGGAQVQIVGDTSLTTYIQSWDIYAGSQRTNYGAINQDGFFSFPYSVVDTFQTYFTGIGYPMDETANSLKFGKITAPTTITDQYILMNLTASGTYNDLTNSGTKYGNYIQSSFGSLVFGIAAPESAFVPIAMVGLDSTFNILAGSELNLYNSGNTSVVTIKLDANNDISLNNISNGIVNNIVGSYTINSYNTTSGTYIPAFRIFTNQTIGINGGSDSTLTITGSGHFTTNLQVDGTIDANAILVNGSPIEVGADSSVINDLIGTYIDTTEAIISLSDTTGITNGYVQKYVDGALVWAADISESGSGIFNPDDTWIDTTAIGEATLSDAVKDTIALVKNKLNATDTLSLSNRINLKLDVTDTTAFRTFSDLKYSTSDVDSNVVNDLIENYLTDSSYASSYTGAEIDKVIGNTLYSVIKTNPDSATTFTLLRTKAEIVIDSVFALVQGTSAVVDWNLGYGTNRTSGQDFYTLGSITTNNVTVGQTLTPSGDNYNSIIPVNNMIWLNITNTDNSPEEFLCVIYYH